MSGEKNDTDERGAMLARCPFANCESKPAVMEHDSWGHPHKRLYEVHCCFCGTTTRLFDTSEQAIAFWNYRDNSPTDQH